MAEHNSWSLLCMSVSGASPCSEECLTLTSLTVSCFIVGRYSQTDVTMVWTNDSSLDVEGELAFPLPDSACLCGYAVDINGVMVDAVVVEKEVAREVFEQEKREGIKGQAIAEMRDQVSRCNCSVFLPMARETYFAPRCTQSLPMEVVLYEFLYPTTYTLVEHFLDFLLDFKLTKNIG